MSGNSCAEPNVGVNKADASTSTTVGEVHRRISHTVVPMRIMRNISRWLSMFIIFVLGIVCMDISIARARYHHHLQTYLVPIKETIQVDHYIFHEHVPGAHRVCPDDLDCEAHTCKMNALLVSTRRQEILKLIRTDHPTAEYFSVFFDGTRGVDQDSKLEILFQNKPCEGIIASSDKTNWHVDLLSIVIGVVGLFFVWKTIKSILQVLDRS
jgi:hypothetical protein